MTRDTTPPSSDSGSKRTLTVDWERYGAMLETSDLSDEQKLEFLQTLWSIVTMFVDLGFGVHSVQQVCGQDAENAGDLSPDLVDLSSTSTQSDFETAAAPGACPVDESGTDRRDA